MPCRRQKGWFESSWNELREWAAVPGFKYGLANCWDRIQTCIIIRFLNVFLKYFCPEGRWICAENWFNWDTTLKNILTSKLKQTVKQQIIDYHGIKWPAGSMWAGAQPSPQETQNQSDTQSEDGRLYIHAAKKLELLDCSISQEEQQKLQRAATSTLSIPCCWGALEEPPETWSLPAAPGLRQPRLVLFSVLCSLAKPEGALPHQDSSRIFPQHWHFSCKVTGEKLAWLHPTNGAK